MKDPRTTPRLRLVAAAAGGAVRVGSNRVVIRLPDPRVIRLVVRLTVLAVVVLAFPRLRSAVLRRGAGDAALSDPAAPQQGFGRLLPTLVTDLKRRGLLRRKDKVVFHHDAAASDRPAAPVPDGSANFVFSAAGSGSRGFDEIDRILTINGVAAIRLSSDSESFVPPANYRMTYIRRIGAATVVAVRKFAPAVGGWTSRRLLSLPKTKKEALNELEDVLLEPPSTKPTSWRRSRKTKFLPELTGDSLDEYPRRLFVEVVPAGREPEADGGAAAWFERHYPKKDRTFEFVQLVEMSAKDAKQSASLQPSSTSPASSSGAAEMGMAEWLEQNVKEEEYVVVKAEAEAVEEMVAKGAVRLVDELFLECEHQWGRNTESRRPYWQCLELYGKLRDQGVAVHQWWGSS